MKGTTVMRGEKMNTKILLCAAVLLMLASAADAKVLTNSSSVSIFILKEPYHPNEQPTTTIAEVPTTAPPETTLPPATTTTVAPATTTVRAPTTTVRATTTTVAKETGQEQNVNQGQPGEEEPGIIGYATAPLDFGDWMSLYNSGFRNLMILLILIAGYGVWARDTQLKRRQDEGRRKGGKR